MRKPIGLILLALSIIALTASVYFVYNLGFWFKTPVEKLQTAWNDDLRLLEKAGTLPKPWGDIKEVVIKGDNSPVQDWLPKLVAPAKTKDKGRYRLEVFFIHWIEGYRYGVVVQQNLVDLATTNTVWELNRTYRLGIVY